MDADTSAEFAALRRESRADLNRLRARASECDIALEDQLRAAEKRFAFAALGLGLALIVAALAMISRD
ncbi:MAG: hypothetical protein ACOYD4_00070 [Solirubrobacterales bacterium]